MLARHIFLTSRQACSNPLFLPFDGRDTTEESMSIIYQRIQRLSLMESASVGDIPSEVLENILINLLPLGGLEILASMNSDLASASLVCRA
jgi:hypothetical protein